MSKKTDSYEIVTLENEITVVGIDLAGGELPITYDSLGALWTLYFEKYRDQVKEKSQPEVDYAICFNENPEYLAGTKVKRAENLTPLLRTYLISAGRYLKHRWGAEDFDALTSMTRLNFKEVKEYAKEHDIEIDYRHCYEVYEKELTEKHHPEMYVLYPLK